MNKIERVARRVDAFQQRQQPFTVIFAIIKKFGDDNAGVLVTNLAFSGFVAVFPLLLLMVTVLGIVLNGAPHLQQAVQNSVLVQFPVIGTQLLHNIHALHSGTIPSLIVSVIGLLWGSTGLSQAGIFAMEQVWNIPGPQRPNYVSRLGRSVGFLTILFLGIVAGVILAGLSTSAGHQWYVRVIALVASAGINIAQFWAAFRILTPKSIASRELVPGSVLGGLIWTGVQSVAGYLVGHNLKHDSELYGAFAIVLGLVAWIYLGARVAVYAAEINVVLHTRLWPRGMVQPPLTPADQESMRRQATENQRRPEQQVHVTFTEPASLGSIPPEPVDSQ